MNVITIDLEMNQPSGEICQLGYCIHNVKTGKLLQNKAVLVKLVSHYLLLFWN